MENYWIFVLNLERSERICILIMFVLNVEMSKKTRPDYLQVGADSRSKLIWFD